jgi:6-phosphofructokinase 1
MKHEQRIGLLTSGKITPGINAFLRAAARSIFKKNGIIINIEKGLDGLLSDELISMPHWSFFNGLLFKGGSVIGLPEYGDPFKFPFIRNGKLDYIDKSQTVLSTIEKFNIDVIIMLGSFDDIKTAIKLSEIGVKIVFIPNIITNDLNKAKFTFGFHTAVQTAASALDKLHTTAESHNRIFIVEVIGDSSGWIALESGISGGADVILIPEIPFKIEDILNTIVARIEKGAPFSLIVAASGSKPASDDNDFKKVPLLQYLNKRIRSEIPLEVRGLSLNLIQMGGSPIAFDRIIASQYGYYAVEKAFEFKNSVIIVLNDRMEAIPMKDSIPQIKNVPFDDIILKSASSLNISVGNDEIY